MPGGSFWRNICRKKNDSEFSFESSCLKRWHKSNVLQTELYFPTLVWILIGHYVNRSIQAKIWVHEFEVGCHRGRHRGCDEVDQQGSGSAESGIRVCLCILLAWLVSQWSTHWWMSCRISFKTKRSVIILVVFLILWCDILWKGSDIIWRCDFRAKHLHLAMVTSHCNLL